MIHRGAWLALIGLALFAGPGAAQTRADLYTQGVRAYVRLDLNEAITLLRRAIRRPAESDSLTSEQRATAMAYLAAAELVNGQPKSAEALFTELVLQYPDYRPDEVVFPPEVTQLYASTRSRTRAVVLNAPGESVFRPIREAMSFQLVATSPHEVTVVLRDSQGAVSRELYSGRLRETMEVRWDGRVNGGRYPDDGRYTLEIASLSAGGRPLRVVRLPLDVTNIAPDTLPVPARPSSTVRVTRGSHSGAARALGAALGGAAAIVILPAVMAPGSTPTPARIGAAGLLSLTGIVAFLSQMPRSVVDRAPPGSLEDWERQAASIHRQNAERMAEIRLSVRTGAVTIDEPTDP